MESSSGNGQGQSQEDQSKQNLYLQSAEYLDKPIVKGYDFNQGLDYGKVFATLNNTGFQATNLGLSIDRVNEMIKWRLKDEPVKRDDDEDKYPTQAEKDNLRCTIFLGYTSNMASCGMREYIRYLCQHKMIDCIVTTTGGIEEDFMKCLAPHYIGDFYKYPGKELRLQGLNRIGNLIVPNMNYCKLESFMVPLIEEMHKEQKERGTIWSPSAIINKMGQAINNEESIYYWCWKNNIPVFSPALTDGAIGDIIYFYSYKESGFIVDIAKDIRLLNDLSLHARKTG
jgi:deoxyhypusine synthase